MSQTAALFLDAYRDLNARKMFWIVLIISTLVAASFALVGLTPTGFSILAYDFPSPLFNRRLISPAAFYKLIFLNLGIDWWLTVFATCLALISTASLFPDFLAGGAVDLYLSKPISRLRLFLTKYVCGLLFVALQIACFCLASFLVIGLRGNAWEPGLFLAIPIVVLFYSYLYCLCVLIGVATRSTVAAILLTLLFWVGVIAGHTTEVALLMFKLDEERTLASLDHKVAAAQAALHQASATAPSTRQATLQSRLQEAQEKRADFHFKFDRPHRLFYLVKSVLPKTSETVLLLQRQLIRRADLPQESSPRSDRGNHMAAALQDELRRRGWPWIVGTSVAFECVVLTIAAMIFCWRDY